MHLSRRSLCGALAASGLLAVLSTATAAAPPPAAASPSPAAGFQQHYEAAVQLFLSEHYTEALKEFEAAYAVRQLPRLLINIGTTHRKLGEAKAALSAYEAYLRIEPNPDPEVKKKLDEALTQVRAMLNLTAAAAPASQDKGSHGKAPKSRPGKLKPDFTLIDLGIDRLKPQAMNKPSFSGIIGTGPQDLWAVGSYGTIPNENYALPSPPYTDARMEMSCKLPPRRTSARLASSTPVRSSRGTEPCGASPQQRRNSLESAARAGTLGWFCRLQLGEALREITRPGLRSACWP